MSNPWFRLYSRIMTDPKIEMLSFEDQRHYVWILCMKNEGFLDEQFPGIEMFDRMMGRKLGLQGEALDNAKRRLVSVGLISEDWQPRSWLKLQFVSDHDPTRAERQRKHRDKLRNALRDAPSNAPSNAQVTPVDSDTDTDTEKKGGPKPRFSPPSAKEVAAYCAENRYQVDAGKFCDYYTANGWRVGKNPMKDWKAAVRTWTRNGTTTAQPSHAKSKPLGA
jgi:hypothetical protein